ncbi:hypothetical protein PINS_up014751 [Pythium insidiosum]|nr:hypothetical protein PINS_up014751 [Pythium insidiosum]
MRRGLQAQMQEDEPSTFVTYDRFEKKMLEVMYTNEYAPDTDETLLAAFRVIDTEKRGYIEADVMRELLITKGTPFREKEMEGTASLSFSPSLDALRSLCFSRTWDLPNKNSVS